MSDSPPVHESPLDATGLRFCVVAARFNGFVVDPLVEGALGALRQHGAREADLRVVRVPGAFELPLAVSRIACAGAFDAMLALGAVIRGGTPHFEYVAGECARGLMRVMLDTGIPVVFGVLTTDTAEQAIERAGPGPGNKGAEAALCAIEMALLLKPFPR